MTLYSRTFKMPFEEVLIKATQNLERQGFGVITTIDVQHTLQEDLHIGFRKYKILGACHPQLAYQAVSLQSHAGMLLPCHIVIQEHENGEVEISAINPLESIAGADRTEALLDLSREIGVRLRAAIDFIERKYTGKRIAPVIDAGSRPFSCFIPG